MGISVTCPSNQWDVQRFHWAVVNEVRSRRVVDMCNVEQVSIASKEVMLTMLVMLVPAGNA